MAAGVAGSIAACGTDASDDTETNPDGGDGAVPTADGGSQPGNDGAVGTDGGAPGPSCDPGAADAGIDCTGKCGPVKDPCSSAVKQCGGCVAGPDAGPVVCDLTTNTCGTPKTTCADLGAECGTLKNSCGNYLDCPEGAVKGCKDGKECDPDTHKCRDCQAVTCQDLGFECGSAFLGCGEDIPANQTNCGTCAADDAGARKCNALFHTCEPSCTPKSATEICNAAKTKKGVECGVISNGCGGTVNCDTVATFGCKNGESCGVRGVGNRCDVKVTPDECKAVGKNCGEVTSACTGAKIKCGDCATGQVCNANGVCGAPCEPKTCTDFAQFQCGVFDDGCGGTVPCGCPNGGLCDNKTNTCCAASTCATTYAGKCGSTLPNGCGQNNLPCACTNPATCTADGGAAPTATTTPGICCTPLTAKYYLDKGQCGTGLPNGCGQNNVNALNCGSNKECVDNLTSTAGPQPGNGKIGSCCTRTDSCGAQAAPACAPVQNSCRPPGTTTSCAGNCTGGKICDDNLCCTGAAACAGNGGEGAVCNTVNAPVDPGCGTDRTCDCSNGRTCWCGNHVCAPGVGADVGACKAALTCTSAAYNGKCGTKLDNGVGGTIPSCGCPNGQTCSETADNTPGTCKCNNPTGAAYTCLNVPNGPSSPTGDKCGTFDNGCGGTIPCNCTSPQTCNTTANPNVCCTPTACPTPALGSKCGPTSNGCGSTPTCGCPTGSANSSFKCVAGACACTKDTCRGRTGPQPDLCGGTLACGG